MLAGRRGDRRPSVRSPVLGAGAARRRRRRVGVRRDVALERRVRDRGLGRRRGARHDPAGSPASWPASPAWPGGCRSRRGTPPATRRGTGPAPCPRSPRSRPPWPEWSRSASVSPATRRRARGDLPAAPAATASARSPPSRGRRAGRLGGAADRRRARASRTRPSPRCAACWRTADRRSVVLARRHLRRLRPARQLRQPVGLLDPGRRGRRRTCRHDDRRRPGRRRADARSGRGRGLHRSRRQRQRGRLALHRSVPDRMRRVGHPHDRAGADRPGPSGRSGPQAILSEAAAKELQAPVGVTGLRRLRHESRLTSNRSDQ